MKHYKDPQNNIYAYESDGSQDGFIPASYAPITDAELAILRQPKIAEITASALAQVRALRAALFPTLAGLQSEALARGNAADAMAIATMQQGCRDITATDLTGATTKAEIELKFKQAWLALLSNAPPSVVSAFRGLSK